MLYLLAVLLAYLLGALPIGVIVVRLARGFDVRRIGSRRSGATNVLRAAGALAGASVLLLDLLKGAGSVWLGRWLAGSSRVADLWTGWIGRSVGWPLVREALDPMWVELACGLAAIAGHNWPIYIRFRGGRGVATALGTLIPLSPPVAGAVFVIGMLVVAFSRYVSLGSVTGASLVPVGMFLQMWLGSLPVWVALYGLLLGGMVVFQHRDNIARLCAGTERRLGDPVPQPPPDDGAT